MRRQMKNKERKKDRIDIWSFFFFAEEEEEKGLERQSLEGLQK